MGDGGQRPLEELLPLRAVAVAAVENAMYYLEPKQRDDPKRMAKEIAQRDEARAWFRTVKARFWVTAAGLDYEAVVGKLEERGLLPTEEET